MSGKRTIVQTGDRKPPVANGSKKGFSRDTKGRQVKAPKR